MNHSQSSTEDSAPSRRRGPLRFELTARTMVAGALLVGGVWLLTRLWPILVMFIVALVLVGTLNPLVDLLGQHRLRRPWALLAIFLGLATVLTLVSLLTIPPLARQLSEIVDQAPALQSRLAERL